MQGKSIYMKKLSKKSHRDEKLIIGWNELVDLPEWGILKLKAKVDTGARSSAIHVEDIKFLANDRVGFYVVTKDRLKKTRKRVIAKIVRKGKVKPSHGIPTKRLFVKTTIRLGPVEQEIELNLVDRENMNFRMLIGRSAFGGHFLVDVSHSKVLSKENVHKARIIRK